MSIKQMRQDRRIVGRSPVTHHNYQPAPGHDFGKVADDKTNGQNQRGNLAEEGQPAPGANGPAETTD